MDTAKMVIPDKDENQEGAVYYEVDSAHESVDQDAEQLRLEIQIDENLARGEQSIKRQSEWDKLKKSYKKYRLKHCL